jgi:hypothetical protein
MLQPEESEGQSKTSPCMRRTRWIRNRGTDVLTAYTVHRECFAGLCSMWTTGSRRFEASIGFQRVRATATLSKKRSVSTNRTRHASPYPPIIERALEKRFSPGASTRSTDPIFAAALQRVKGSRESFSELLDRCTMSTRSAVRCWRESLPLCCITRASTVVGGEIE